MRYTATRVTPLLDALGEMFPDSTRTTLRQMLTTERVRVNGEVEKVARRLLAPGDKVEYARREHHALLGSDIPILYEDDDLLVVIKPAGLLTVATEGERDDTLQNRLNAYLKAKGTRDRIHVVHRLDRESSGVLVFAKAFEMRESLKELFAVHELDRVYVAIVEGRIEPPMGTIRTHLWEGKDLQVRSVDLRAFPNAKPAVTHYRTIRSGGTYSWLEVTLETGRRNQIRVHLAERGHPIVGDPRYGRSDSDPLGRLGLHARLLGFVHPRSGKKMTFEAPVPRAFGELTL